VSQAAVRAHFRSAEHGHHRNLRVFMKQASAFGLRLTRSGSRLPLRTGPGWQVLVIDAGIETQG